MTTENNQNRASDHIAIQEIFQLCLAKWHWFVISLALALLAAFIYIKVTPPVYERKASMLIKEDSKGSSLSTDVSEFSNIGLFQSNVNVNNEIVSLRSYGLMLGVVERLHLDVDYMVKGRFHDAVIYGTTLPVKVLFDNTVALAEGSTREFVLELPGDGTVALSGFIVDDEKSGNGQEITGNLLDTLQTPAGRIVVVPTRYYDGPQESVIEVVRRDPASTARHYSNNLSVRLNEKETTIVDISLKDVSAERAEEVLNTLITIYNENWIKDKNQVAVTTSSFINDRLNVIEQELGDVDENIASFKSENLVPDVAAVSAMYMSQSKEVADELQRLDNLLYMSSYILRYMNDNKDGNRLLPAGSGIESAAIEQQISEYNDIQMQRNKLVANSSEQNPLVMNLDRSLASLHAAIVSSVENYVMTLDEQIKNLRKLERKTASHISESPTQAKDLLSVERQQKVKEALYLFLLQKREENELSQTFAAHNTRIVQSPIGSIEPSAPVKMHILAIAFTIGLLIPAVVIFLRESTNTTVRGRKDLEGLSLPLIGEIPLFHSEKKGWHFRKKAPASQEIVVEHGKRDVVNEAFRVLRTNLEFMTGQEGNSNVMAVTSFNAGSGKSVIAVNMAVSLAIKGKKVLVIDGDMRHASVSKLVGSPDTGLSNYLNGKVDNPVDCIVVDKQHPGFHILPVGTIPPNPTELLETGRLAEVISIFRGQYDYILVDCPPIDIVADTQIIEKQTDRTIFIVRVGLLDRDMLPELEGIYTGKRFKNMVAVLNATPWNTGHYGYRYGYRYGYAGNYYKAQ